MMHIFLHFIEEMLEKEPHLRLFFFQIHDLLYLCKKMNTNFNF